VRRALRSGYRRAARASNEAWGVLRAWRADGAPRLGASIAFYTMFSLAPVLVIAIALAGAVLGVDAARGQLVAQIAGLVGTEAAQAIEAMIRAAWREDRSVWAALAGTGVLLVGASGVFMEIRNAFDAIWRVQPQDFSVSAFVRARLTAFALVLAVGFLALVSLLATTVVAAGIDDLARRMPVLAAVAVVANAIVSFAAIAGLFAMLLRWLPSVRPAWRDVAAGAVASALLFEIGKYLIGLYLGRASVASAFGAAGSFVVVMLWVYYCAQILLVGAEYARLRSARRMVRE
jgi:membrane protein